MKIYVPSINIKGLNKEPDYEAIFASGYSAGYEDGYDSYPCLKKMPLTVEVLSAGTIYWRGTTTRTIQYKKNKNDWADITSTRAGAAIDVAAGDIVKFRGSNPSYEGSQLVLKNGSFNLLGNIMSLIDSTSFPSIKTLTTTYTFRSLFQESSGIIDASNLLLPATSLTTGCYRNMFYGCTSLTAAPELPATVLANDCYYFMFRDCTSLTTAPELPATTLANSCYLSMFQKCTSLTKAPSILPATTLAPNCYDSMFQYCTSLTTAPELPAPFSAEGCYSYMFGACGKLNYIKCLALGYFGNADFGMWASAVASSGTFVKDPNANNWPRGWNGIPNNWTIVDAS